MDWRTKLLNPTQIARQDYNSLVTPVYRGSTVVFDDQSSIKDDWQQSEKVIRMVCMERLLLWSLQQESAKLKMQDTLL